MLWGPLKAGASWLNNDFGEYFEWADGNINDEDRIGYMVQLSGEKIELAKSFKKMYWCYFCDMFIYWWFLFIRMAW